MILRYIPTALLLALFLVSLASQATTTLEEKSFRHTRTERNSNEVFANLPIYPTSSESRTPKGQRLVRYHGPFQTNVGISSSSFRRIKSLRFTFAVNDGEEQELKLDLDAINAGSWMSNVGHWVFDSSLIELDLDWESTETLRLTARYTADVNGEEKAFEISDFYKRFEGQTTRNFLGF